MIVNTTLINQINEIAKAEGFKEGFNLGLKEAVAKFGHLTTALFVSMILYMTITYIVDRKEISAEVDYFGKKREINNEWLRDKLEKIFFAFWLTISAYMYFVSKIPALL